MDPTIINPIISGTSALLGSIIGGLFVLRANTRAQRNQRELYQAQLRGQLELKARELMFGVYQRKMEEFTREVQELGAALGKFGAAMHLSDVDNAGRIEAMMAFMGTMRTITDPIVERIEDIEQELAYEGLSREYERQLGFVKSHLTPDLAELQPIDVERRYKDLSRALTYVTQIQHGLFEKKSDELFRDYLPLKSERKPIKNPQM